MPRGRSFGSIPAAFAAAGVAVVAIAVLSFWSVDRVRESSARRDHTHVVLAHADDVLSALREAEALQRGYFLTGESTPVARYERSRDLVVQSAGILWQLTKDNPEQQALVASEIEPTARRKVEQLESLMATYRAGDRATLARELISGRTTTAKLRASLEKFIKVERDLLVTREASLQRSLTLLAVAIGSSGLLASLLVAYGAREMYRGRMAAQSQAAQIATLNHELGERALGLEVANQELEAFSYSVSHDLRAPLRHIQGYVDLLERNVGEQLGDKPRRYLLTISESARDMGQLIDDLLSFSRTGRSAMHEAEVDLDSTVAAVIRGLEMAVQGRNITWKISPLPRVRGDGAMIKQVFANLIGNAVKYSRPRALAVIEVGSGRDALGNVEVFVKDNGVGFDMAHAGKLFGVFQRLHRTDQFEGTGIGLATVQRIVARHGGRICAESVPDGGSTFRFTLPAGGAA